MKIYTFQNVLNLIMMIKIKVAKNVLKIVKYVKNNYVKYVMLDSS